MYPFQSRCGYLTFFFFLILLVFLNFFLIVICISIHTYFVFYNFVLLFSRVFVFLFLWAYFKLKICGMKSDTLLRSISSIMKYIRILKKKEKKNHIMISVEEEGRKKYGIILYFLECLWVLCLFLGLLGIVSVANCYISCLAENKNFL